MIQKFVSKWKEDSSFRRSTVQMVSMFLLSAASASAQSTNFGRALNNTWTEVQTWAYPIGGVGLLGSAAAGHWGDGGLKRHAGKGVMGSSMVLGAAAVLSTIQAWSK